LKKKIIFLFADIYITSSLNEKLEAQTAEKWKWNNCAIRLPQWQVTLLQEETSFIRRIRRSGMYPTEDGNRENV